MNERKEGRRQLFTLLGLRREGEKNEEKVWEGTLHSCGSRLTYDDGYGNTCVECGQWKAGGSGFERIRP